MNFIKHISHAGVSIFIDGLSILLDPYSKIENGIWEDTSWEIAESMILKPAADFLIYTHEHLDHFNCDLTIQMLMRHPETKVICGANLQNILKNAAPEEMNISANLLPVQIRKGQIMTIQQDSVTISLIPTVHDEELLYATEHYAVLIDGSKRILALGDTKPVDENFLFLEDSRQPDILVAPFIYLTLRKGRDLVFKNIRPETVAFSHLPLLKGDGVLYNEIIQKNYIRLRDQGKSIILLSESGQSFFI